MAHGQGVSPDHANLLSTLRALSKEVRCCSRERRSRILQAQESENRGEWTAAELRHNLTLAFIDAERHSARSLGWQAISSPSI